MSNNTEERQKNQNMLQEVEHTILFLRSGLGMLQRRRLYHNHTPLTLLTLGNGIERLQKIVILLHAKEQNRTVNVASTNQGFGHQVRQMNGYILRECFAPDYLARRYAQEDHDYMANDSVILHALDILESFLSSSRYAYLDGTQDPMKAFNAPDKLWEHLESSMLRTEERASLADEEGCRQNVQFTVRRLTGYLERYIRALFRLMRDGTGKDARFVSSYGDFFLTLSDEVLGTIDYEIGA